MYRGKEVCCIIYTKSLRIWKDLELLQLAIEMLNCTCLNHVLPNPKAAFESDRCYHSSFKGRIKCIKLHAFLQFPEIQTSLYQGIPRVETLFVFSFVSNVTIQPFFITPTVHGINTSVSSCFQMCCFSKQYCLPCRVSLVFVYN